MRDASTGSIAIFVDATLDFVGSPGVNRADLSFPDSGVLNQVTPWGPYIVLAAEKHDAGMEYPSFNGYLDEVRVWSRALNAADIAAVHRRVLTPGSSLAAGLVGAFRFEETSGTAILDSSASGQSPGVLINNTPGNGLRVFAASDPMNVAPVRACRADFDDDGTVTLQDVFAFLNAWFIGDARADIDGGGLTIGDVFAFLNAWFTGC